ncbi:MAG TPA: VTT domain-containing protein [Acidimicrobiales bacterium]|jgi:membrane protein DedA with SNARE-associated domain|nr:VTT domain-containing protein [Acidimicrobiales bacterium]
MDAAARWKPPRWALRALLGAIVVITVTNLIGDILAPGLVETHPLWLIAMNSRKRWILAVVPHTDVAPFFVVAVLRQLLSDPIYYVLGRWYGDAGARWLEKKMGDGGTIVRWLESGFAKASWAMVAIAPNHIICMLAGASGMPPLVFFVLNLGGTIAAIAIFRTFGDVFGAPIEAVTGFLNDYRLPLIALSAVLVGLNVMLQRRSGKGELESVSELERELEAEAAAEPARRSETEDGVEPDRHA